jgi:hypothetical protein
MGGGGGGGFGTRDSFRFHHQSFTPVIACLHRFADTVILFSSSSSSLSSSSSSSCHEKGASYFFMGLWARLLCLLSFVLFVLVWSRSLGRCPSLSCLYICLIVSLSLSRLYVLASSVFCLVFAFLCCAVLFIHLTSYVRMSYVCLPRLPLALLLSCCLSLLTRSSKWHTHQLTQKTSKIPHFQNDIQRPILLLPRFHTFL